MAFNNFFTTTSQPANDSDYRGIFATSASTVSLSSNLSSLSAEGSEIVKWCRFRMGEPKVVCELDNTQIFSAFEETFINWFSKKDFDNLKMITNSLLFTLIPLHDNDKCIKYYNLINA